MDRLAVGILCHPTLGGSGVVASELARELDRRGHRVHLFAPATPPRLAADPGGVHLELCAGAPYPLFAEPPHDLAAASRLLELERSLGLDVLHAHYALPHAVTALVAAAATADAGRRLPVVTTLHGTDITIVGTDPTYLHLTRFALSRSDAVTCVSRSLADATRDRLVDDAELHVIPNFVDAPLAPRGTPEAEPPLAVHASNLRPVKRTPALVRAFTTATAPGSGAEDARLRIVGDGPDADALRRLGRELGLGPRLELVPAASHVDDHLAEASLYVQASREEAFGLSALEAMAAGLPVLSTAVGGAPEVVEDGVTGRLVELDDETGFASSLRELLVDQALRVGMGARGRERAVRLFGREAIVDRYEALYRTVL